MGRLVGKEGVDSMNWNNGEGVKKGGALVFHARVNYLGDMIYLRHVIV